MAIFWSCRLCPREWTAQCGVVEALTRCCGRPGILARNDARARKLEGLEQRVDVLAGEVPQSVEVTEQGIRYQVDLREGQKTGLFLDQRENRAAARQVRARPTSGLLQLSRWLRPDAGLSMSGNCGLRHLRGGGDTPARERCPKWADGRCSGRQCVRRIARFGTRGERFDTIVLDPPAFAKNKAAVPKATAGYKEINLRALRLLDAAAHS